MIIYKRNSNTRLEIIHSTNDDILDVQGDIETKKVRIILVYMSVENQPQDIERNKKIQSELENKIENTEDRALMILGDFNGHTNFLGEQREDRNGKFVTNLVNSTNMVMLNCDDRCKGVYTWGRRGQRSAIDFVLANDKMYQYVCEMDIDENQEKFDLSDHNLITIQLMFDVHINVSKARVEDQYYFRVDKESLMLFAEELKRRIDGKNIKNIEEFNMMMKSVANSKLKTRYRRRVFNAQEKIKEKPWVTGQVREAIKQRKDLNRKKRNASSEEEKQRLHEEYQKQKKIAQLLVREEISKHERKVTEDIRLSTCKSKALWENITKLRGKPIEKITETHLFTEEGNQMEEEEEKEAFLNFWEKVYQKHENKIDTIWNEESRRRYQEDLENDQGNLELMWYSFPRELREHIDMIGEVKKPPSTMIEPTITQSSVSSCIKKLKNKTAAGPDGLKPELYKALLDHEPCLKAITLCFQEELNKENKPSEWKISQTKMIPKTSKPTPKDLRPIALTNISYKLYMSLLKEHLEQYLARTEEMLELQAGFTKGGRVEDNVLILQYCVEDCYKKKKPLIVASVDYSKAFDSVDRAKMIETLMKYKVHPKMIDSVADIYTGDKTSVCLNSNVKTEIQVTSGIRQGCTGSTSFFKLLTYIIVKSIESAKVGFTNHKFSLPILFFADDSLLLTSSVEDAKKGLKTLIAVSKECGLDINKSKSNIIIYNMENAPNDIENIEVKSNIKYLGITVENSRNMFKAQKTSMIVKAQKMANMTYSVIAKSCNKLLIGKTFWKSLVLPSVLYGTNVITLTENECKQLQVIENGVYRKILGAPAYAPNCTLRGDVGASLMITRVILGRLQYIRSIMQGRNDMLKEMLEEMMEDEKNKWMKTTKKYLDKVGLKMNQIKNMTRETLKKHVKQWDGRQWRIEVESKTSLVIYYACKEEIEEEYCFDNNPSSIVYYRARSNCLALNDRKRHTKEDSTCVLCNQECEDIEHFLLLCPVYSTERVYSIHLQQPYNEKKNEIIGRFLFDKDDIEEKKETIYKMWRKRCTRLEG